MKNGEKLHLLRKIMWYDWKLQNSHYMDFNCIFHGLEFAYKTMTPEWENIIWAQLYDSVTSLIDLIAQRTAVLLS